MQFCSHLFLHQIHHKFAFSESLFSFLAIFLPQVNVLRFNLQVRFELVGEQVGESVEVSPPDVTLALKLREPTSLGRYMLREVGNATIQCLLDARWSAALSCENVYHRGSCMQSTAPFYSVICTFSEKLRREKILRLRGRHGKQARYWVD